MSGNTYIFGQWEQDFFKYGLLNTLILAVGVGALVFFITKIVNRRAAIKHGGRAPYIFRLLDAVIIILGATVVLMTIRPLESLAGSLLAGSGIAAIVLGLAAQEALGNVLSGMAVGASQPFYIGEYIELPEQNVCGTVIEMRLRHTVVRDFKGNRLIIPNSILNKSLIITSSKTDDRVCNYLDISVSYDSDVELAIKIIRSEADAHGKTLGARTDAQKKAGVPRTIIRVREFAENGINIRALIWTETVYIGFDVLSDIRRSLLVRFKENDIDIPYPHRTVIIKNEQKKQ